MPTSAVRVNFCLKRATTLLAETCQSRALHTGSANFQRTQATAARRNKSAPTVMANAGVQLRQQVAKDGLRTFIEKVTAKPKEARMWLKYFKSRAVWDVGQAFCVLHVTEEVFYNIKILETFAWSVAFLMQNGMRPVIVFGTQRHTKETMQDVENKVDVLGIRLQKLLRNHGAESDFFTACHQLLRFNEERRLCIDQQVMTDTLESNVIPIVSNFFSDPNAELKFRVVDPVRVAEVVAQATRPLKVMMLSPEKGIQDSSGQIVSDIVLPFDLPRVQNNNWYKGEAKLKRSPQERREIAQEIERIEKLLESLPAESSVIMTSADTVIQELFTHHGSGTMIKKSEKIFSYQSLDDLNTAELGKLISESFKKPLPHSYFDDIREHVDRVYVTENFTAAAVVLLDPSIGVPYLDKFAVRTNSQGLGISAQMWTEVVNDYKHLFWRSKPKNRSANNWYNSVCQGAWKDKDWIVFWYGLPSCREVFPLIDYALKRKESFPSETALEEPSFENVMVTSDQENEQPSEAKEKDEAPVVVFTDGADIPELFSKIALPLT